MSEIRAKESKREMHKKIIIPIFCISFLTMGCYQGPNSGPLDFLIFSQLSTNVNTPLPIQVQVSGLPALASVSVSDSLGEILTFNSNGVQSFPTKQLPGTNYNLSITSQPVVTPQIICQIVNPNSQVLFPSTVVQVQCGVAFYPINVTVVGISASNTDTLTLSDNGTDHLSITGNGTYQFPTTVADQQSFAVNIFQPLPDQTCIFRAAPSNTGIVNGGSPPTVILNCFSPTLTRPANNTAILVTDTINITLSENPNVGSCVLDATVAANPTNLGPYATMSVVGNVLTITPNAGSYSPTLTPPLNVYAKVTGCTDSGGNLMLEGAALQLNFSLVSQQYYVSPTGADAAAPACSSPIAPCATIQQAVTNCAATSCLVSVSQGTYSVSTPIVLSQKTSLMGGFAPGFGTRSPSKYQTIISDATAGCGVAYATPCAPIQVTTPVLTANEVVKISGFGIVASADPTKAYTTGILFNGATPSPGLIYIFQNAIFGGQPGAAAGLLSGIQMMNSNNIIIEYNTITGGTGGSASAGIVADASSGIISWNRISGHSSTGGIFPVNYSAGIDIRNMNLANTLVVNSNSINPLAYIDPSVTATNFLGIFLQASNVNTTNITFLGNSIYSGNGAAANSKAVSYNMLSSKIALENNQLITPSPGFTCLYHATTSSAASSIQGNNFYGCSTLAYENGTATSYGGICPGGIIGGLSSTACGVPTYLSGTSAASQDYAQAPNFVAATDIYHAFMLTSTSSCYSVYGGINDNVLPAFTSTDIVSAPRTQNVVVTAPSFIPAGAYGYSIGAFEFNGSCK
ncbi:hypothetical protein LEP1GSC058_1163 [Leptospira fainei serovar Hurstbridge str. BUT 6]|uniref:Lipoprotein n=1 Tax=Leptospira fainei serovar Hurstbridge str. BUT 6 TaxID=1193011 RepID=S3VWN8_9LEPT|nr:hypothetical protein [Leptospira fainei]EPG72522.1 hypothetical protein LEP1GSC058_1163 [Leptospira fainei serovar Hurstbridge str. BUT 6]